MVLGGNTWKGLELIEVARIFGHVLHNIFLDKPRLIKLALYLPGIDQWFAELEEVVINLKVWLEMPLKIVDNQPRPQPQNTSLIERG